MSHFVQFDLRQAGLDHEIGVPHLGRLNERQAELRAHRDLEALVADGTLTIAQPLIAPLYGGVSPIELLANDYRAIYTWPQTTKNQAALVALNGRYAVTDLRPGTYTVTVSLQGFKTAVLNNVVLL